LNLLANKLARLMELNLAALGKEAIANVLVPLLKGLRNDISDLAVPIPGIQSRTAFVNDAIALWSRVLSLFRNGALPANLDAYETLCSSTPNLIPGDQNAQAMGLGRLGIALSLLQHGRVAGLWDLRQPASNDLASGAITACASRPDGGDRPIFVVKSATEEIALESTGAFNDNAVVVHADDAWHRMVGGGVSARRVRAAPGRTGRVGATHVSLGNLLARCGDAATLQEDFVAEMML